MSANKKAKSEQQIQGGLSRMERFHPYKTLLFFSLVGSTMLFLSLAFLYFVTITRGGTPENFQLPKAFSLSTILIILSSYTLSGSIRAYRDDSIFQLKVSLLGTLAAAVLFCISQAYGFIKLMESGLYLSSNPGVAYLYIITGMHIIHVVGGMIYLLILTKKVFSCSNDIVKSLLYFTDDFQFTRLQLATVYWHFVDAIWVLLFFMFLFSM